MGGCRGSHTGRGGVAVGMVRTSRAWLVAGYDITGGLPLDRVYLVLLLFALLLLGEKSVGEVGSLAAKTI